jgi:ABC-type transporter Mla subunit MlaD
MGATARNGIIVLEALGLTVHVGWIQMGTKPHYFKIGIFVIFAVTLLVVAVILFGAGLLAHDEMRFESYFSESITGLAIGSMVEFRGVRIGQIESIGFVGNTYTVPAEDGGISHYASYVRVVSAVPRAKLPAFAAGQAETMLDQMIDRGLRASVASNILTGQAYLELNYVDPNRFPIEPLPWKPKYLRVPSVPSEFTTMKDSIDSILTELQSINVAGLATSLESVLNSLNKVITEANVAELSRYAQALLIEIREKVADLEMDKINNGAEQFLASLNSAVTDANIPQLSRQASDVLSHVDQQVMALNLERISMDIEHLLGSLEQVVADANVPELSGEARTLMVDLRETNKYLKNLLEPPGGFTTRPNVPEVIAGLNQTVAQLNRMIATERPQIDAVLSEFQQIAQSLNDLVSSLKEQPSSLLFGKPPRKSEVLK